jgi:cardiolipin synthase A/B
VPNTGGIDVGDEYLGWQDIGFTIHGPGVNQLQEVFDDDWHFTTDEELTGNDCFCELSDSGGCSLEAAICETIAGGPDQAFNATRDMVFTAVTQCSLRSIATPYFVPDIALLSALRTAVYIAESTCSLLEPARNDAWLVRRASRVFYPELLPRGRQNL